MVKMPLGPGPDVMREREEWKPCCIRCPWRKGCRWRRGKRCVKPVMSLAQCE